MDHDDGLFQILNIIYKAAMDILVQIFVNILAFWGK